MSNGNATIFLLTFGLIARYLYIKWIIFHNHIPVAKTK